MIRTYNKTVKLLIALVTTILFIGLILSANARIKFIFVVTSLSNAGLWGVIMAILIISCIWTTLKIFKKLFAAKGFNKIFWDDL